MANDNQSETATKPKASNSRGRSASYPRYNLQQAEGLAKAVFDEGVRNCDEDVIARKLTYSNARNGAFVALKSSANQFGLIEHNKGYISVTDEWINVFHSENTELFRAARQKAMYKPTLYRQLLDEYSNRQLPSADKLKRELYLNERYGILKEAADLAIQTFLDSASFASILDGKNFILSPNTDESVNEPEASSEQLKTSSPSMPTSAPKQDAPLGNPGLEGLDRIEVHLVNGKKAFLYVPVLLPFGEKERLKRYIDLFTEEPEPRTND